VELLAKQRSAFAVNHPLCPALRVVDVFILLARQPTYS